MIQRTAKTAAIATLTAGIAWPHVSRLLFDLLSFHVLSFEVHMLQMFGLAHDAVKSFVGLADAVIWGLFFGLLFGVPLGVIVRIRVLQWWLLFVGCVVMSETFLAVGVPDSSLLQLFVYPFVVYQIGILVAWLVTAYASVTHGQHGAHAA